LAPFNQLEIFSCCDELGIVGLLIKKLQLKLEKDLSVLQKDSSGFKARHDDPDFGNFVDEVQALHLKFFKEAIEKLLIFAARRLDQDKFHTVVELLKGDS